MKNWVEWAFKLLLVGLFIFAVEVITDLEIRISSIEKDVGLLKYEVSENKHDLDKID